MHPFRRQQRITELRIGAHALAAEADKGKMLTLGLVDSQIAEVKEELRPLLRRLRFKNNVSFWSRLSVSMTAGSLPWVCLAGGVLFVPGLNQDHVLVGALCTVSLLVGIFLALFSDATVRRWLMNLRLLSRLRSLREELSELKAERRRLCRLKIRRV